MVNKLNRRFVGAFVASCLAVVACSETSDDDVGGAADSREGAPRPPLPTEADAGELLARVELTKTHYIEFRGAAGPAGGVGIIEFGQEGETPVDRAGWEGLGPEAIYTQLSTLPAPSALVQAAEVHRAKQIEAGRLKMEEIDVPLGSELEEAGETMRMSRALDKNVGIVEKAQKAVPAHGRARVEAGLGKITQAAYGDSAWFTQTFCNTTGLPGVESSTIWCVPQSGWVQGGTRYTMYYHSVGMSAPTGQGASYYVEWYDWAASVWRTHYAVNLTPGQWASVTWNGETTFRSSIYGTNNSAVHMVDAQRRQIPYFTNVGDHPKDHDWDDFDDVNGVTHDSSSWYFTRTEYSLLGNSQYGVLAKIPAGSNLTDEPLFAVSEPTAWRAQFPHFGDLTRRGGYLYVAMEGPGGCAVGVFNTALEYVGFKVLKSPSANKPAKCAWIAFNPYDGLFYAPHQGDPGPQISKYKITLSGSTISSTAMGTLTLSTNIPHIQGAEFSSRGTLYLFAGNSAQPTNLYAADSQNGFVYWRFGFTRGGGPDSDFEAEGLTVWDLTSGIAPNVGGHLHLQILRNDDHSGDQVWMPHLAASDPSAL